MRLNLLSAAMLLAALFGPADLARAQGGGKTDVLPDLAGAEGPVAELALAQKLYHWGAARGSAVAVAAAYEMLKSVDVTDVDRVPVQAATDGVVVVEAEDSVDAPVGLDQMLATAMDLAAGDAGLLGVIEDIEAASSKGRIGGASRSLSRLPAGYNDTFRVRFQGGVLAELAIVGDGDADLDLLVTDETGSTICYDTSYSDQIYCSWTPNRDGEFIITVKNMGRVRNSYYLLTN